MKMRAICAVAALVGSLVLATSAAAEWMHTAREDDPFAGGAQQFAGGIAESGEMLMFRCTSKDDIALLYVSNEKPSVEADRFVAAAATADIVKLLVIIDDDPVSILGAKVEITANRERYRFESEGGAVIGLAKRALAAKRRMAVAVELSGKRIYSTAVNMRGSGSALGKLVRACKLGAD